VTLQNCIILSCIVFAIGIFGMLRQRSVISLLISIELMLNAVMINFVAFAYFRAADPTAGSIFCVFIIALTSAEMAIALAVVIALYRNRHRLDVDAMNKLHG
jgi:NADH:ubiquinone oxidoreductase subunit K